MLSVIWPKWVIVFREKCNLWTSELSLGEKDFWESATILQQIPWHHETLQNRAVLVEVFNVPLIIYFDRLQTDQVIKDVEELFHDHPNLVSGFSTFLPAGYHSEPVETQLPQSSVAEVPMHAKPESAVTKPMDVKPQSKPDAIAKPSRAPQEEITPSYVFQTRSGVEMVITPPFPL